MTCLRPRSGSAHGLNEHHRERREEREQRPRVEHVGVQSGVADGRRDLTLETEPHEALGELMDPERERQERERDFPRVLDLGQRGDADAGDDSAADEVRFCGEAHQRVIAS
jgi:hypothetical protein